MLEQDELCRMDDELSLDEPSDVLATMPGMRQRLDPDLHDGELGLRAMLERPELLSKFWWRTANGRPQRVRRHVGVLRAA
jgi:hypothetical protein